jgi:glyoxylase-like metal-dependent hydrolase (beta-lactamase superfamily II)
MHAERIAPGVFRLCTLMVNVYFVESGERSWVLVDTGMRGYAGHIQREAERIFNTPPVAILLTHGHFDHIGGLPRLAHQWGVPVYAHPLEMPYLMGRSKYPPPDPTAGGGAQSWLSPLFSRGPIDLDGQAHMLPSNGAVPGLPSWRWLATEGHSPGHVSFFRESDRTLIAGDAVVTTRQESMICALTERPRVWRPPAYFTCDWIAARRSVERLAALEPSVLATGHGRALAGPEMRAALWSLAVRFDEVMPSTGRYVPYPAIADEHGVVHVPPRAGIAVTPGAIAAGIGAAAVAVGVAMWARAALSSPRRTNT